MSAGEVQPVDGASPPVVFSRWMKVVFANTLPPAAPFSTPTFVTLSQGMALGETTAELPDFTSP